MALKGFPEAITTVFPLASVQTCIVHLSRYCLSFCGWKERQAVARELKAIYRAETVETVAKRLSEFDAGPWGRKYPMIAESWRRNWEQIIPFYSYPPEVRKIIYTTNAIESLHMQLRKVLKNRGALPERRGGHEAHLSGLAQHHQIVEKPPADLEDGGQPIRHSIWGEI